MPRLRFVSTVQGADTIELQEPIITIGRDIENVVSIEDGNISKHHALLIKDGPTYKIFDLHSINGTTVNGKRITTTTLKEGDAVRIGYLDLTYEIALTAPTPPAPVPSQPAIATASAPVALVAPVPAPASIPTSKAESEPAPVPPVPPAVPVPAAPEPPATPADSNPPIPPAGPRKFGAPPTPSGMKFRLKRD